MCRLEFDDWFIIRHHIFLDVVNVRVVDFEPIDRVIIFLDDDLHFLEKSLDDLFSSNKLLFRFDVCLHFQELLQNLSELLDLLLSDPLFSRIIRTIEIFHKWFKILYLPGVQLFGIQSCQFIHQLAFEDFDFGSWSQAVPEQLRVEFYVLNYSIDLLPGWVRVLIIVFLIQELSI